MVYSKSGHVVSECVHCDLDGVGTQLYNLHTESGFMGSDSTPTVTKVFDHETMQEFIVVYDETGLRLVENFTD